MVMCFASCEKAKGTEDELSGDDIIQFEDAHFLHALLTVQEIEMYDSERDDYIKYLVDVDTNRDGQVSVNEAKEVRGLDLYNYETDESFNVLSMPEIKYFTALEYLNCIENQLTSLDLSKNIALKYLGCSYNQLTSLDLSKNTALKSLDCFNNQLTSLDVSNNTALRSLECHDNQLTSLDVSNNTALDYFACGGNQLTSLDISKNPALEYLNCHDNQLTSLDVSNNTALTTLLCGDNLLETLIISASQQNSFWIDNHIKTNYPNIKIIVK